MSLRLEVEQHLVMPFLCYYLTISRPVESLAQASFSTFQLIECLNGGMGLVLRLSGSVW